MRAAAGANQFWLRKLHSLTGFAFLGYFLCFHVRGGGTYGSAPLRALFLYLPLLFHGLYGLYIGWETRPNGLRYPWVRNWMYLGQRASGVLLVPFVPFHLGAVQWGAAYAAAPWYRAAWAAGLLAAVFHLANGLFGTAVDWGVTVGPHSQRVLVVVCLIAFLVLSGYGLNTLVAF
jgi:succinate dehydrogenase / fumarate reductase cytochrome b subunit